MGIKNKGAEKKPLWFYVFYAVIFIGVSELALSRKFFSIACTAKD